MELNDEYLQKLQKIDDYQNIGFITPNYKNCRKLTRKVK